MQIVPTTRPAHAIFRCSNVEMLPQSPGTMLLKKLIVYQYLVYVGTKAGLFMSKNTSVELGEEIAGFVSNQVQSGRYGSASEVIRAGIRLLQDQDTKMEALRETVKEGEISGAAVPFDIDQFIKARKSSS